MDFDAYLNYFKGIINHEVPPPPYNDPLYIEYTKLNWSRTNRWLKYGELNEELVQLIKKISNPQHWIIITEPWCGDAAHSVPFMHLLASQNAMIEISYELRDAPPHRIEQYLTNGSKSIPVLIVRSRQGDDLFRWGPRPAEAQALYLDLKARNADFEEEKIILQKWYNEDKGQMMQEEFLQLMKTSWQR